MLTAVKDRNVHAMIRQGNRPVNFVGRNVDVERITDNGMRIPLLLICGAVLTIATSTAQVRRVDDATLRHAGEGGEWLTYGLNQSENRYSTLAQITTANVKELGLAWSYDVGSGGGGQEATPLFSNGTIYGITNWSVVFAVDARTGKERWRWDPEVNQATVRMKICCGVVNRGLAIYQGMVIAPAIDV
jgi:quinohemoprotein ethanol dehydrogenase